MPMYQVKSFNGAVKDLDIKQGIITAYWSAFDNIDSDGDIMGRDAFNKSISERGPKGANRIMFLYQHNPTLILGKPSELYTDAKGLIGVAKIEQTSYGADVLKLYESGIINEHSIGFQTIKSRYDNDKGANLIQEVRLWEGSAVTWGANELTPVISGKSTENKGEVVQYYDTLCKAIYSGTFTDDTFQILEVQKRHIEAILSQSLDPIAEPTVVTPSKGVQADEIMNIFKQFELTQTFTEIQKWKI